MAILINMTIEQLKQWRKDNGYTQKDLSKSLGVHIVCVARWETGTRKIPSFLHLALRCLELEGGEPLEGAERK
jgi:transcriptional regulator with XRE-family HTH domain